jgi:hypothetical protein
LVQATNSDPSRLALTWASQHVQRGAGRNNCGMQCCNRQRASGRRGQGPGQPQAHRCSANSRSPSASIVPIPCEHIRAFGRLARRPHNPPAPQPSSPAPFRPGTFQTSAPAPLQHPRPPPPRAHLGDGLLAVRRHLPRRRVPQRHQVARALAVGPRPRREQQAVRRLQPQLIGRVGTQEAASAPVEQGGAAVRGTAVKGGAEARMCVTCCAGLMVSQRPAR